MPITYETDPPSVELRGTSVFSSTGSPQEERAGDLECFSPRMGPGRSRNEKQWEHWLIPEHLPSPCPLYSGVNPGGDRGHMQCRGLNRVSHLQGKHITLLCSLSSSPLPLSPSHLMSLGCSQLPGFD